MFKRTLLILGAAGILCGAVCWSAIKVDRTLQALQIDYLRNQAVNLATSLELAARDLPVNQPSDLQATLEEVLAGTNSSDLEAAIVSHDYRIKAHSDPAKIGSLLETKELKQIFSAQAIYRDQTFADHGESIYQIILPVHLGSLKRPEGEIASASTGTDYDAVILNLNTRTARFIVELGRSNLYWTLAACAILLLLVGYSLFIMKRFLQLEAEEARDRQWVALGRMSATLAHEIRNPIGAVKGFAQLLAERSPLPSADSSYLMAMIRESERLETLVANLLIFSKPKSIQPRLFQLREIWDDLGLLFEKKAREASVFLDFKNPAHEISLQTDYELFKRVLINVVENAIQSMPKGGTIAFSTLHDKNNSKVRLTVDDEGDGLNKNNVEKIFEPFYTTRASGTGLGLAISRQIMQILGGSIQLENRPTRGVRCTLELPAAWGPKPNDLLPGGGDLLK
jgi:two-component system, NtrC family, sensor histidine kinase HydH